MSILLTILGLGALIVIHELGHYLAARWAGVAVKEFSIGFGPKLLSVPWKGTIWSIRLIPLGGFVDLKGSNTFDPGPEERAHSSYYSATPLRQLGILLGGVIGNFVGAILIMSFVLGLGTQQTWINQNNLDDMGVNWMHLDENQVLTVAPLMTVPVSTAFTIRAISKIINDLPEIFGNIAENLGGPVAIIQQASEASKKGLVEILHYGWSISLSLIILNLLPIPGLDGGKILFLLPQLVLRRRLNTRMELGFTLLGGLSLIVFVVYITIEDILSLFR